MRTKNREKLDKTDKIGLTCVPLQFYKTKMSRVLAFNA